jgi:hypothetical protein
MIPTEDGASHAPGVHITCIHCFTLVRVKEPHTTVVVGYSNGQIRIFSQMGEPLVTETLHDTAVTRIRSQPADNNGEDLAVLYGGGAVVVIDGFTLGQLLRACLSRIQQGGDLVDFDAGTALHMKKWGIEEQEDCHDIVCLGQAVPSAYDRLMQKQSDDWAVSTYITSGFRPMLTGYTTRGCESRPFFSATALAGAVASKLGSAMLSVVTSFWGSSKSKARTPTPEEPRGVDGEVLSEAARRPADPLALSYSLEDPRRRLRALYPCPRRKLIAMTDDFGRVLLFDHSTSTIARVWKGYRDAQCGWVSAVETTDSVDEIPETLNGRPARSASAETAAIPRECVFLVILAPKRLLLEIWNAALGTRVAAFNVAENSTLVSLRDYRLIHTGGGMPGECYLMGPNGHLKDVTVPFESALSNSLSASTQDRHQLRRLRSLLARLAASGATSAELDNPESTGYAGGGQDAGGGEDEGREDEEGETPEDHTKIVAALEALEAPAALIEALDMLAAEPLPDALIRSCQDQLEVQSRAAAEQTEVDPVAMTKLGTMLQLRQGQIDAHAVLAVAACTAGNGTHPDEGLPSEADTMSTLGAVGVPDFECKLASGFIRACLGEALGESESLGVQPFAADVALGPFIHSVHKLAASARLSDDARDSLAKFCFQAMLEEGTEPEKLAPAWLSLGLSVNQLLTYLLHRALL